MCSPIVRANNSFQQITRRLQNGCQNDDDCNNGKCHGYVPPGPNGNDPSVEFGECRCKDGWEGSDCTTERCGDVDSCGKHGKCRHDECECDDGWTGDDCDDEIEYTVKLVVAKVDTKTRGGAGCEDDLKDFFDDLDDADDDDKDKLSTVTVIRVPTQCGDGKTLHDRSFIDLRRRHLKKDKDDDDDEKTILIGVVLVDSSTRKVKSDACIQNLKDAADDLSDKNKAKKLEDMDGKVVVIEAGDECSSTNARAFLDD